jgi:hypothetical protein
MQWKSARDADPLAKVLEPPPNEGPAEREARLLDEMEAKRLSDSIDDELKKQRIAEQKRPKGIKVLLLGMHLRFLMGLPLIQYHGCRSK